MVNVSLVEAILREQENPGSSTSRKIRELYNTRSGEDPIVQHTEEDKEFQSILLSALEAFTALDDEEAPISYTVKLKESVENITPAMKRRSIIKLPKENKSQSESDDASSDSEKIPTASSITITKPFSPLFLNNMKKFGVSTDWLAKRSNSVRHSSYSRSSIKSNTSKLDAMIKSASAKPIRSNRKLSFIEDNNISSEPIRLDFEKENVDPVEEVPEQQEEPKTAVPEPSPYDLSSEVEEDKENEKEDGSSPTPEGFSLRIARVNLKKDNRKRVSSSSSNEDPTPQKTKTKKKRISKQKPPVVSETKAPSPVEKKEEEEVEPVTTEQSKKTSKKKEKADPTQTRIEHLKKLLRTSGIRSSIRKAELEELQSDKARIKYLKSLFDTAGFTGSLSMKECQKFREKRDNEQELLEIRASTVDVKGHVKGGRTLRGQARTTDEPDSTTLKRKRAPSTEVEDNVASSENDDDDKLIVKKQRVLKMEASPEVSESELDLV